MFRVCFAHRRRDHGQNGLARCLLCRSYDGQVTDATTPTSRSYLGRRIIGIGIDWLLCMIIAAAFFPASNAAGLSTIERVFLAGDPLATLGIWMVQHLILVATLGTTVGHRITGLRVVRDDGTPFVGIFRALGRTILIALVIPAVVWDHEGRGLHDRAVATRIVPLTKAGRD